MDKEKKILERKKKEKIELMSKKNIDDLYQAKLKRMRFFC